MLGYVLPTFTFLMAVLSSQSLNESSSGTFEDDAVNLDNLSAIRKTENRAEQAAGDPDENPYSMDDNLDDTTTTCACEQAIILYSLESKQFSKEEVEKLAKSLEVQVASHVLNKTMVITREVNLPEGADRCDALKSAMSKAPGQLVINIDPGTDQTCGVSKRLVMQTPLVEFNAFSPNDSINWLVTAQSKSIYLRYQFHDIHATSEIGVVTLVIRTACAPTIGRSNISEEYSRLQWSEVEARYNASLPMYGIVAAVAAVMCFIGIWMCIMFVYRTVENDELKEQRAIRLYIAELVRKEHEREAEEDASRLAEILKKYKNPICIQPKPSVPN